MCNSKRMKQLGYLWSDNTYDTYTDRSRQETPDESAKDALRVVTGCSRKEVEEWQKEYSAENCN